MTNGEDSAADANEAPDAQQGHDAHEVTETSATPGAPPEQANHGVAEDPTASSAADPAGRSAADPAARFVHAAGRPAQPEPEAEPTVIRDRRRIDPITGQLREPATPTPSGAASPSAGQGTTKAQDEAALGGAAADLAADRLADLQRLQAEYMNYRKRVDRDRDLAREKGVAAVLESVLPVLDDIDAARAHGELTGPFAAIAEKLDAALGRQGLVRYGEVGSVFDPAVHEAFLHSETDEVSEPTVSQVLQAGYLHKDKVLRAARVAVTAPTS